MLDPDSRPRFASSAILENWHLESQKGGLVSFSARPGQRLQVAFSAICGSGLSKPKIGGLVQLIERPVCTRKVRGLNPRSSTNSHANGSPEAPPLRGAVHSPGTLAQQRERWTVDPGDVGSSPIRPARL